MQQPCLSTLHTLAVCRQGGQIDAGDPARVWQQAFFKLASAAGVPVDPSQATSPDDIIQQVQAARQRDPWVQVGT